MKRVALLLLLTSVTVCAQWSATVTAVTSGDFDDINPQVDHAGLNAAPLGGIYGFRFAEEWLVFERWAGESDAIAAARFLGSALKWDSLVATISPAKSGVVKKYPDVCTARNGTSLAAWQEESGGVWNIYYSLCNVDSGNWSTPATLTNDTVSNCNVELRALSDSSFVLLWKRGSAIVSSVYNDGNFSPIDTLVQSNTDSTDYDFAGNQLVWTEKSNSGYRYCLISRVENIEYSSLAPPDTLACDGDMSNPRFVVFLGSADNTFTFDLCSNGRYSAWWSNYPMLTGYTPEELAGDTASSYLHAVFYAPAYLTFAQTRLEKTGQLASFNFYAWERQTTSDTSVVFYGSDVDSVQQGSGPSISPLTFPVSNKTSLGFVAWQSDRSGRSHIYSRSFLWIQTGLDGPGTPANTFKLSQNYPNPFNPSTVIGYQLSAAGNVSLKVYDILGREVAALVDGRQSAGTHTVVFDGSKYASGVYFYRLTAGGTSIVSKMILER
ncbi:MAG TPA: T9SS type A sorting domain-containing protein [Candidatus Kryptobacter bacterium]|nr:T9SS type A sorting domain-containing protein [Candidatus Kryptobacter bacterium]